MDNNIEAPRFLLLLPPAPQPSTFAALRDAYADTIKEVLKEVASHSADSSNAAVLEIALACEHLVGAQNQPRSSLYDETQHQLAGIYKLVCVVAAETDINVEDADGVDVRVLLVAWSFQKHSDLHPSDCFGPVIDLHTLANCGRQWQYAFGVETESGGAMVSAFVKAKGHAEDSCSTEAQSTRDTNPSVDPASKHSHVAVGGTFDHLHIGHKLLITMTIFTVDGGPETEQRSATIGITGDQLLVKKKHASYLESWSDRQTAVATFFNAIIDFSRPVTHGQRHVSIRDDPGPNGKSIDVKYPSGLIVKCTEIQDPFGPTITEEGISALVISAETRSGGNAVNDKRVEKGWKALDVFEVDVLDAESESRDDTVKEGFDNKLSSTAIREKLARKAGGNL